MGSIFKRIGLDIGSQQLRVVDENLGIVWQQPCCLARHPQSGKVLAVGHEAVTLQGRLDQEVRVVWPVDHGVMAFPEEFLALLKVVLKPYWKPALFLHPTLVATVPVGSTLAERQSLNSLLLQLGASDVVLVAQPLTAMIGAGVPVADPTGSCFLHVGHGVVEAGVIALGSVGVHVSSLHAGAYLDWRLRQRLQFDQQILISFEELELLKQQVVTFGEVVRSSQVTAKHVGSGEPTRVVVKSDLFLSDLQIFLDKTLSVVRSVLRQSPAELLEDSVDKGILLSGGLGQLDGLDRALSDQLRVPVLLVDRPAESVAWGLHTIMLHLDQYRQSRQFG